jgi:hypothetical protein
MYYLEFPPALFAVVASLGGDAGASYEMYVEQHSDQRRI